MVTLWKFNIAIENGHLQLIFPLKIVIFHSYPMMCHDVPWLFNGWLMACYLLGSPGSPGKSYQHPATVPAVHRLALSRNGLAQACEGHTGEELLQLAQAANANNVNQPFDGAWCYIVPYYHDIVSTKCLIVSKSCIWYQIFRQAQMPQITWMILDLGLTFTKWVVNRFRNKKMHCAVLNCLVLLCLRLQLWVVCDGCDGVLPGCLARLSYQNTCFLPQPQQSCESDANSYAVCSPKIQQNVTNERLK